MVKLCEAPGPLFSLAGFSRMDFDATVRRTGAIPHTSEVISLKQKIDERLSIFMSLPGGRYAALTKSNRQSEFEIGLQRVGWSFFEDELNAVLEFVGVDSEYVDRNINPPIRWIATNPIPKDIAYWESKIGTKYPY